jgi:hypothetical protein
MLEEPAYRRLVTARRSLRAEGFASYAEVGCETGTITPYHLTCGNRAGPVLISFNWLDAPTARAHAATLRRIGHLPAMLFNRVLDTALTLAGLTRADIYLTHASHLLPATRSASLPQTVIDTSFDHVTRHEIAGRPVAALGRVAVAACARFGIPHQAAPHPSARGLTLKDKAAHIAEALTR